MSDRKDASTLVARIGANVRPEGETLRDDRLPVRVGEIIAGKFKIESVLGEGGMGVVASATHMQLGERVALKFLKPNAALQPDLVARFAREARATAKIKSEHVARVIDVGELDDGSPYIVMEYLDGRDLARMLRDVGPLPIEDAVEYVMQACEALAEAHSHGIIHRDVKLENLFAVPRGEGWTTIKVLDFGISKAALTGDPFDDGLQLTQTLSLMGSPLYMSPEQIRRSRFIDHRTDIWSLGIVLHELLTGKAAFVAQTITQLCALVLEEPAPSLRVSRPAAPVGLDAVVQRCLEKDPDRRFQNVAELAIALLPFGPRRARLTAERVSTVIRASGMTKLELRLPMSLPPPAEDIPPVNPTHHSWTHEGLRSFLPATRGRSPIIAGVVGAVLALAAAFAFIRLSPSKASPAPEAHASARETSDLPTPAIVSATPVAPPSASVAPALPEKAVPSAAPPRTAPPGARPPVKRRADGEPDLGF